MPLRALPARLRGGGWDRWGLPARKLRALQGHGGLPARLRTARQTFGSLPARLDASVDWIKALPARLRGGGWDRWGLPASNWGSMQPHGNTCGVLPPLSGTWVVRSVSSCRRDRLRDGMAKTSTRALCRPGRLTQGARIVLRRRPRTDYLTSVWKKVTCNLAGTRARIWQEWLLNLDRLLSCDSR